MLKWERNVNFSENFAYVLNGWSLTQLEIWVPDQQ